jgi:predicted site-specific integrase-resolvase
MGIDVPADGVDRLLRVSELAAAWQVPPETIYGYIRKGLLRIERLPSGAIRVLASEAQRCGAPVHY